MSMAARIEALVLMCCLSHQGMLRIMNSGFVPESFQKRNLVGCTVHLGDMGYWYLRKRHFAT